MSKNGNLLPNELTYMGNENYLANSTANSFNKMSSAIYNKFNILPIITYKYGGYRDIIKQEYMINNPTGPVKIAKLGFSSHGLGTAVDINNFYLFNDWLKNNAKDYNFYQEFSSEPWHWKFNGTEITGSNIQSITKRKKTMTTLYHDISTKPILFALAGDSPGTPANWLETNDYDGVAVPWARTHGDSIGLTHDSFIGFKDWYLSPLKFSQTIPSGTRYTPAAITFTGNGKIT